MATYPDARYATPTPSYASSAAAPTFTSASYGSKPAATATPKSLWEESAATNPGLYALNDTANSVVGNQLNGVLSPETLNSLRDNAATFGVTSGMPGSGVAVNRGLRDLGRSVQDLQNLGFQNYMGAQKTTASQQLDPSLVANIEMRNADLAAAPDPAAAAGQENALYQFRYQQQRQAQLEDEARAESIWQSHYNLTSAPAQKGFGGVTYGGGGSSFSSPYNKGGALYGTTPGTDGYTGLLPNSPAAQVYGYNSSGVWGNMEGQSPWSGGPS